MLRRTLAAEAAELHADPACITCGADRDRRALLGTRRASGQEHEQYDAGRHRRILEAETGYTVFVLFGEYLLEKGAIDEAALLAALDEQQRRRTFLGALAVREGLITVSDVLRVVSTQSGDRRSFGMLALDLGVLDEDQLDRLLALQRSSVDPLGELLVESGAVEEDQLHGLLDAYFRAAGAGNPEESPAA